MIESELSHTKKTKVFFYILWEPKAVYSSYPDPKYSLLGPQKVKNDPKINSKSKVSFEGTIENKKKVCLMDSVHLSENFRT